jgi:60 kDa SS-A/Ro ribonucleoprotein
MRYAKLISEPIAQTQPLNDRQVKNNAGGFVFAKCVERCYAADPARTVSDIVEISVSGRAPKNDPAIFALAIGAASSDEKTRQLALSQMHRVCRTGTHLFQFVTAVRSLGRGWGRTLKRAVADWYDKKPVDKVAYQVIKYRSRENLTHKRMLQSAHPAGLANSADLSERVALYRWICEKEVDRHLLPAQVEAHVVAMASTDIDEWVTLVGEYNLPWEALPTEAKTKPEVWQALLPNMGLTALIRNLGNMTRLGAIKPLSQFEKVAVERIKNKADLRKSRIHPFNILQAMSVYGSGHGLRGAGTWSPSSSIVAALDDAFYASFANVVPTGKRTFIGLDVSSSMSYGAIGSSALMASEAAAAMSMVFMRTEPWTCVMGFAHELRDLGLSAKDSLRDVVNKTARLTFGGTDCAQPMLYALQNDLEVDAFYVITDNETHSGYMHPVEALRQYRKKTGIPAKLVVIAMTSTGFTIADPQDGGMLDCVGFDSSAPAVIADFVRGGPAIASTVDEDEFA